MRRKARGRRKRPRERGPGRLCAECGRPVLPGQGAYRAKGPREELIHCPACPPAENVEGESA